jgi:hypothetical protein
MSDVRERLYNALVSRAHMHAGNPMSGGKGTPASAKKGLITRTRNEINKIQGMLMNAEGNEFDNLQDRLIILRDRLAANQVAPVPVRAARRPRCPVGKRRNKAGDCKRPVKRKACKPKNGVKTRRNRKTGRCRVPPKPCRRGLKRNAKGRCTKVVGGARHRRTRARGGALSEWQNEVRSVRSANPGMSYKDAMIMASALRRGAGGYGHSGGSGRSGGVLNDCYYDYDGHDMPYQGSALMDNYYSYDY